MTWEVYVRHPNMFPGEVWYYRINRDKVQVFTNDKAGWQDSVMFAHEVRQNSSIKLIANHARFKNEIH